MSLYIVTSLKKYEVEKIATRAFEVWFNANWRLYASSILLMARTSHFIYIIGSFETTGIREIDLYDVVSLVFVPILTIAII